MPFVCSICEQESTRICVSCTKDTCGNHLCEKCGSCSDCCSCEVALDADEESHQTMAAYAGRGEYSEAEPEEPGL